ncbi:metallophosphoesterase family protein [Paenibacillus rhizophilus]|uniref:Metallophosphoesterase n=1 Tax=Paenibacillus rhizophilus TaxID=1850366 RepID=A0A3N9PC09_9BACL|nr:metallophosphoesterase family protein [Paenibacillus rhizophilus]RQW13783.1 metallophosphoesterase [Paenibacillus rhizophilus]
MERIAIISDIHGNMPALRAVLKDIAGRGITRIQCLGDMVGKGPEPAEALDLVRESCESVVIGNWESMVIDEENVEGDPAARWHRDRLGGARLNYIRSLPFGLEWEMSGRKVRLFHASPESVYVRVQPWASEKERLGLFLNTEATAGSGASGKPDIVGYGDIHHAYLQYLHRRMLFNAGSVGTPRDEPTACFCIMEGVWQGKNPAPLSIQFIRVPYNIEEAAAIARKKAEQEGMPGLDVFLRQLTTMRPGK